MAILGDLLLAGLIFGGQPHMPPVPPVDYTYPSTDKVEIRFLNPLSVHVACGGDIVQFMTGNRQIFACAGVNKTWIIMPDPCAHTDESYARLMCHELGHTKGWPADHPNEVGFKKP